MPRNKVKDTLISTTSELEANIKNEDEKTNILAEIKALNEDKKEIRQLEEPIIPVKKAKFKIKDVPKTEEKISVTITEEQLNMLTYTIAQGFCAWTEREDMQLNETAPFSKVLYDIGMQQGWFKNMDFLPYLVLLGAGFDLSMKIVKKPKKQSQQSKIITESAIIEDKIEHVPNTGLSNAELGKVDVIDQDLLVKKLGGGKLYKNTGEIVNE